MKRGALDNPAIKALFAFALVWSGVWLVLGSTCLAQTPEMSKRYDPPSIPQALECAFVNQGRGVQLGYRDQISGKILTAQELQADGLSMEMLVDGQVQPMALEGNNFLFEWRPETTGPVRLQARLKTPEGVLPGPELLALVIEDLRLKSETTLDFSKVPAGCEAEAHCQKLDISRGLSGLPQGLVLVVERLAQKEGWEELGLHLRQGETLQALERGQPVTVEWNVQEPPELCYAPPSCTDPGPEGLERVRITPQVECITKLDQAVYDLCREQSNECKKPQRGSLVTVRADVDTDGWLSCNLWWILSVLGLIMLGLVIYGVVSPHNFPLGAKLRVASEERQLRREPGRPLNQVPHGKRGFYRSATCCFTSEGMTIRRTKGHILKLKAGPGRTIEVHSLGCTLERKSRRWMPVGPGSTNEGGVPERTLARGDIYRINGGDFYFIID